MGLYAAALSLQVVSCFFRALKLQLIPCTCSFFDCALVVAFGLFRNYLKYLNLEGKYMYM